MFRALRNVARRAGTLLGGVGILLAGGFVLAGLLTWIFAELAGHVMRGGTEALDTAVLSWVQRYHSESLDTAMLEVTALGTGLVVLAIVGIAGLFLYLNEHRYSALLLVVATAGGLVLNSVLKLGFERPRPEVFDWGTHVVSSSFPSGHAMSATIVYSTVAYLAARLQRQLLARALTFVLAALIVVLIAASRVYLGVHYPSDVVAGGIIGLAWAAFCMATLEAVQRFAGAASADVAIHEKPPPPRDS